MTHGEIESHWQPSILRELPLSSVKHKLWAAELGIVGHPLPRRLAPNRSVVNDGLARQIGAS
jgi:hypothetical protein